MRLRTLGALWSEDGQATVESAVILFFGLAGGAIVLAFASDILAALTLYVRGFYVVLGYPIG